MRTMVFFAGAIALTGAMPSAAAEKAAPPFVRQPVADWTGAWASDGSLNLDPTTEPGKLQPNAPLTPEARKDYEANMAAMAGAATKGKPIGDSGCLPEGVPMMMRGHYPREFAVTPKETWILAEFKSEIRRIYTDGRKAPTGDDLDQTYGGYSTGHWEGDTLVFDTVGLKAGKMDNSGLVHSDQLTLHERMRRIDFNTMEDRMTLTDPKIFTKPWTITRRYKLRSDWQIKEYVCAENERNVIGADGTTGIILKPK